MKTGISIFDDRKDNLNKTFLSWYEGKKNQIEKENEMTLETLKIISKEII